MNSLSLYPFHAIFSRRVGNSANGRWQDRHNWSKIDQLYDNLLPGAIRPFVELGFTPTALATSSDSVFYWNGNTSHPKPEGWHQPCRCFYPAHRGALRKRRSGARGFSKCERAQPLWLSGRAAIRKHTSSIYDLTAKTIKSIDLRCGSETEHCRSGVASRVFCAHVKQSGAVAFVKRHT